MNVAMPDFLCECLEFELRSSILNNKSSYLLSHLPTLVWRMSLADFKIPSLFCILTGLYKERHVSWSCLISSDLTHFLKFIYYIWTSTSCLRLGSFSPISLLNKFSMPLTPPLFLLSRHDKMVIRDCFIVQ